LYKIIITVLIIILTIYISFTEIEKKQHISDLKIEVKDIQKVEKQKSEFVILKKDIDFQKLNTKVNFRYSYKSQLENLKEKSKDRRLKIKRFKENKIYFHRKHEVIESFKRDILKRKRKKKYLITKSSKYRDSKYRNYLLHQKEKTFRTNMVKKLIEKREY